VSDVTIQGFRHMQARMIALILRHDELRFRSQIGERRGAGLDLRSFSSYRNLAVVFQLRDSLFESILPSIMRRLSFESPNTLEREELPARGRIHWERSFEASWNERPDQAPLEVYTRVRRRDFATPANLLTIITILEYQAHARELLDSEGQEIGDAALRHPLHGIIESCERALRFPQFAALRSTAQAQLDAGRSELIEAQLSEQYQHISSAYSQLLEWRRHYHELRLIEKLPNQDESVLGSDPKRADALFQHWLYFELVDLLQNKGLLDSFDSERREIHFRWGEQQTEYLLRHEDTRPILWQNAPGARPDYYIYRKGRHEIRDGKQLLWQEPGYLLDAKYYQPRDSKSMYSLPLKRMLADLELIGEHYGSLLFAYTKLDLEDPELEPSELVALQSDLSAQHQDPSLQPAQLGLMQARPDTSFELSKHIQINGWQIPPHDHQNGPAFYLSQVLDQVHARLHSPREIHCYGSIADIDTVRPAAIPLNQQEAANERCSRCGGPLAFCPKPHVSANRIDRVCPQCDCLKNKRLCHIIGQEQAVIPLMVQRVLNEEDLYRNIKQLREWFQGLFQEDDLSEEAEQARNAVIEAIGQLGDSFIKYRNPQFGPIEESLRKGSLRRYWLTDPNAIAQKSRDMLLSGEYIWYDMGETQVPDWAACAVQHLRALENELHRRFYLPARSELMFNNKPMKPTKFTFGSIVNIYQHQTGFQSKNWQVIHKFVLAPNRVTTEQFDRFISQLTVLYEIRNRVAHRDSVSKEDAHTVRTVLLGDDDELGLFFEFCQLFKVS
jgi:hypothetical protein